MKQYIAQKDLEYLASIESVAVGDFATRYELFYKGKHVGVTMQDSLKDLRDFIISSKDRWYPDLSKVEIYDWSTDKRIPFKDLPKGKLGTYTAGEFYGDPLREVKEALKEGKEVWKLDRGYGTLPSLPGYGEDILLVGSYGEAFEKVKDAYDIKGMPHGWKLEKVTKI